jgi:hypothetical protein
MVKRMRSRTGLFILKLKSFSEIDWVIIALIVVIIVFVWAYPFPPASNKHSDEPCQPMIIGDNIFCM